MSRVSSGMLLSARLRTNVKQNTFVCKRAECNVPLDTQHISEWYRSRQSNALVLTNQLATIKTENTRKIKLSLSTRYMQ